MMRLFVLCLVTATLLWPALAQAPDADFSCIDPTATDPSFQPYPEDWRVLFDTWNYERLLTSGGVLQALNSDGEGNGWMGQQSTCREQLRVCDYRRPTQPQNNWVFTQYISYLEANEVNVDVTYDYTSCATNQANGCNTLQTTMYLYERNGADNSARTNLDNYILNELQVLSAESRGTFTSTFTFLPSANISGFYLGVQDTGTCGNINRITVYYRICPRETQGLVTLPETPLPPDGTSQHNTKTGTCAANSSPTNPIYRAFADGRCETSGSCDCDSGFRLSGGSSCVACPAGTYRSDSDPAGSCLNCPNNTDMTREVAPSCACLPGYYRTATEGAGANCTSPPSAPTNNQTETQSSTTITISWERPASPGGRENVDLYYIIEYRKQGSLDRFMRAGRRDDTGNMKYTYIVMNLEPFTNYLITVTAENGVSDQESNLRNTRTVEIPAMTAQGASEGNLRLIGGVSRCEGRLQLSKVNPSPTINSLIWSTTCHRDFSTEEIRVTCRQLGCPTDNPSRVNISRFGGRPPSPHDYTAFGFTCSGQESKVVNCPYTGAFCDIRNEKGNDDIIGVSCNEGDKPTAVSITQPSDPPGKLRLAGGLACIGRLEVCVPFLGEWAQAVYRNFGPEEVQVACRELGCGDQGERIGVSRASEPYLQVGYDCTGNETMLKECEPAAAFSLSAEYSIGLRCATSQQECPLDHLPVWNNQGELEACLPCSVGSTRVNQNDTKCMRCKLQYFSAEGRFQCRVCPPGSKRPDQSHAQCVCGLLYQPVTQNNTLVHCMRCPAGSSRLSQDDLNCTCNLRFYPVMQNGKLQECHPCPVSSSRLNHSVSECTCQLQLYPVPSPEGGMLLECHPCPLNSARKDPADSMCTCSGNTVTTVGSRYTMTDTETCTICPLEYTISKEGLHSVCEPCPPGSRRQSHADENCTCGHSLEYYPVIHDGILQACNHCPPGSSRLSLSTTECTCYLDYYNSTAQNSNGSSQGSQCNRCSPGSSRPKQNAAECECQQNLLSHIYSNFTLWCLHCPMNSEKKTSDDRECTCLEDTVTINESTTTIFDVCSGPPVARKPTSDFMTTMIAGTTITGHCDVCHCHCLYCQIQMEKYA